MNERIINQFSNVPNPRPETVQWVKGTDATRDVQEIIKVELAPSGFFEEFAASYVKTIDSHFIGPFAYSKPKLPLEKFSYNRRITRPLTAQEKLDKIVAGEAAIDDLEDMTITIDEKYEPTVEDVIVRYAETIFWANIAENKREFCKTSDLKNLLAHIRRRRVVCPILVINAINCIGPVVVSEKALRLEPTLLADYPYADRVLTLEQFEIVSDWFDMLTKHGFQCVEYVKLGAEGNRDFMMMTLEENTIPSEEELEGKDYWKTEFNLRSTKIAANIVGIYRYFFYTGKVKYLSDERRIFQFGTYGDNRAVMKNIVETMLRIDNQELFSQKQQDSTPKPPNQDPAYQEEQSRDDKAQQLA